MDSSSALALIRRAGTSRLNHIQTKQVYLQILLRAGVFSVFKINTKLNPGDMNAKRLGGERRKLLGRFSSLYSPSDDEGNDDNAIRYIKRVNRATREQCIRLIQMAGVTMGMCMQLKGCNGDVFSNDGPVTGGNVHKGNEWQLVRWTLGEWTISTSTSCMFYLVMFALHVFFYALDLLRW
jgi:hypothetical protein